MNTQFLIFFFILYFHYAYSQGSIGAITWYCRLNDGTCNPGACGLNITPNSLPAGVDGIAAYSINLFQSNTCQQCWRITGTVGTATVWITDKCGGVQGAPSCYQQAITNGSPQNGCDWCWTTDHKQFDVDASTFEKLCGSIDKGWCFLQSATQVDCGIQSCTPTTSYVVKSGDSVWQISQNCGTSVNAILALNLSINPNTFLIFIGQVIILPEGSCCKTI